MARRSYTIKGMSCQNCVRHVRESFEDMDGVASVEVNLDKESAIVDWTGQAPDFAGIKAALEEEGYEIAENEEPNG